MTLNLYKRDFKGVDGLSNVWCFDDSSKGIVAEPFVAGMSEIITNYAGQGREKCQISFSNIPFEGFKSVLTIKNEENGGAWYIDTGALEYDDDDNLDYPELIQGVNLGWLCPCLFKYFPDGAPKDIYFSVE